MAARNYLHFSLPSFSRIIYKLELTHNLISDCLLPASGRILEEYYSSTILKLLYSCICVIETIGCNPGTVSAPNLHRDLQTRVLSIFNHGHSFASLLLSIASSLGHVCGSLCLNVINGRLLSFNVLVQLPHC